MERDAVTTGMAVTAGRWRHRADNHLFFPGAGPSTPAEYEPAQHVDEAVGTDIGLWFGSLDGHAPREPRPVVGDL